MFCHPERSVAESRDNAFAVGLELTSFLVLLLKLETCFCSSIIIHAITDHYSHNHRAPFTQSQITKCHRRCGSPRLVRARIHPCRKAKKSLGFSPGVLILLFNLKLETRNCTTISPPPPSSIAHRGSIAGPHVLRTVLYLRQQ